MADLHKSSFARLACSTSSSDVFLLFFFLRIKRFHDDDADNVVSSINIKLSDLFYLHLFEEDPKLGSWVHSNCHWFLLDAFFPSKVFSPAMVKRELLGTNATNVHVSRKDDAKNVTFLNRKLNVYLSSFRQNLANINGTVDALNGHVCVKLRMSFFRRSLSEMLTRWACVSNCPTCMMPPIYIHPSWENIRVVCRH